MNVTCRTDLDAVHWGEFMGSGVTCDERQVEIYLDRKGDNLIVLYDKRLACIVPLRDLVELILFNANLLTEVEYCAGPDTRETVCTADFLLIDPSEPAGSDPDRSQSSIQNTEREVDMRET